MVAAFQLNLFNTSAIEGESARELSQLFPPEVATAPAISRHDSPQSLAVRAAAKLVPYFHNRQAIPKGSASRCANKTLSRVMTEVAGSTDAEGVWIWKDAYDAVEAALVTFIQQEGNSLISQQGALKAIEQIHWLCPTHTRRSEEAIALQQFSTPLAMAYVASVAAQISAADIVLEPSAGTGLLAVWAEIQGARLILNEIAPQRRDILEALFPKATISGHNAEQIDDYLDKTLRPTAIVMNPPFSASPKMAKRNEFATWKHITSALARLQPGGRLVTITANWFSPLNPDWRDYFVKIQKTARVAFSAGIAGQAYAKHGTLIETRLTVIDKVPADNPGQFAECYREVLKLSDLLGYVNLFVPPCSQLGNSEAKPATPGNPLTLLEPAQEKQGELERVRSRGGENYADPNSIDSRTLLQPAQEKQASKPKAVAKTASRQAPPTLAAPQGDFGEIVELQYTICDWDGSERELSEGIYEPYKPQVLAIEGAAKHPTPLVQSVAMASVAPPKPTYRPLLPKRVIEAGLLSDIQLESVIYAVFYKSSLYMFSYKHFSFLVFK